MKKVFHIIILLVISAALLSACSTPDTVTQAPASPTQPAEVTNLPTQAQQSTPVAPVEPPAPAPTEPPVVAISGQTLMEERCGSCHAIERVTGKTGTFEDWGKIVDRMITHGAKLTDEERAILVQFLADTYK